LGVDGVAPRRANTSKIGGIGRMQARLGAGESILVVLVDDDADCPSLRVSHDLTSAAAGVTTRFPRPSHAAKGQRSQPDWRTSCLRLSRFLAKDEPKVVESFGAPVVSTTGGRAGSG